LAPVVAAVPRELVLEAPGDDDLPRLPPVEHLAQPFEDAPSLEAWEGHALPRKGPLEGEVKIRDDERPLFSEEECEIACCLNAPRDLDTIHALPEDERRR